jgi:hypothetical protein
MLAYIGINSAVGPAAVAATATADSYYLIAGKTLEVKDLGKGVMANDVNIYGVKVNPLVAVVEGTVTLNTNGTFTFVPTASSGSFGYCGNGATSGAACATVTLNACITGNGCLEAASGITVTPDA